MKNKPFLIITLLLSVLLAVLNFFAGMYFWYWRFWWFDLLMHFIGGLTLSSLLFYFSGVFGLKEKTKIFSLIFFPIISIAIIWEIMEFLIDDKLFGKNYFFDTTTDIFIALFGALVIFLFSDKIRIKDFENEKK